MEKSIVPVRVEAPGGGWTAPDATLERRADGSIGPKAATVDVTFSAGGTGSDLVTIAEDGRSVSLGWPGRLPAPRLDGPRAVYEDILPDVDLIMTATVEGYRQVLEVQTPKAAANPELKRLEFAMEAEGLTVKESVAGGVETYDANGQVVFRAPAAQMWNSAGDTTPQADSSSDRGSGPSAQIGALSPVDPASPAENPVPVAPPEEGDPLAGPGAGDESAVLDVAVDADSVTVTPDTELLAQTEPADYPVYIDPTWELNESERTVLSSDGDVFYNFSGGSNGMSVGKCGSAVIGGVSYYCGNGYVNRMYFEFAPDQLKGKHVLDATFRVTETWSFSCDARWVDLERTNNISSASKWPGPAKLDQMGDRHVSAGRGSHCSPSQPRAPIEFNDNPDETDENLTATVRSFATGGIARLTLMLMAKDETDTISWKRFDDDAVLSVTYVGIPALPRDVGFVTSTKPVCSTNSAAPSVVSDPTPQVTGTPLTVSGGSPEAKLRIRWRTDRWDGTAWVTAHTDVTSATVGNLVPQSKPLPTLQEGVKYRLKALTLSYYDNGINFLNTGYTAPCYFSVDSLAPKAPNITFNASAPYTPCTTNDCVPGGKPGLTGSFTVSPAAGDTNVAYRYQLSTGGSIWTEKSGATVTINPVPPTSGTMHLSVKAKDSVGRWGATSIVEFVVKEGDGPIGRWSFDETSGAAVDSSTTDATLQDNATLAGGAMRTDQGRRGEFVAKAATGTTPEERRVDSGLKLDGTAANAATAGQVLDTRASYTVTAWVRLEKKGRNYTVLGQDGAQNSPFYLGYCETVGTWCVRLADADSASTSLDNQRVNAKAPATTGVWTHLTAVVDAEKNTMTLYVNGNSQGSDTLTSTWSATGALQIGRAKHKGLYTDYFAGVIDEVGVWQGALNDIQVEQEMALLDKAGNAFVELVAGWNPAGKQGTSLTDSSGYSRTLTLSSGASLNGENVVLDGTTGAGTTPGPVVDDSGSFTVTTEALVDSAGLASKPVGYKAQILGQKTATDSSWSLWFEKTGTAQEPVRDANGDPVTDDNGEFVTKTVQLGRWHFGRLTADGTGASVVSNENALMDSETRLTGIYDAQARTISLHLTADRQGEDLAYTAAVGSGEFAVGKGYLAGAWGNYLPGRISDIRLWAGALSSDAQVQSVVGT
ncbi:LamG-like jellyroll fold domain-containing protein [Streptomyces sp. SYSU K21746]